MGCFLGCFGDEKDHKRRKRKTKRPNPPVHRNRVLNVQQETVTTAEKTLTETLTDNFITELQNKPTGDEQPNHSPRKRVTFNSNITTYEHVSIHESIDSLSEENQDDIKTKHPPSNSLSDDDTLVTSSVGSYPPNHRYHNARDIDDEYAEYVDSDLDDLLDDDDEEEEEEDHDESFLAPSTVSVLKPIENITQWKAVKSKGARHSKSEENGVDVEFEAGRVSFTSESKGLLFGYESKSDRVRNGSREMSVDASLSNWLVCPRREVRLL